MKETKTKSNKGVATKSEHYKLYSNEIVFSGHP